MQKIGLFYSDVYIFLNAQGREKWHFLCNLVFRSEMYNSIVSVNKLVDLILPIQVDSSSVTNMTE